MNETLRKHIFPQNVRSFLQKAFWGRDSVNRALLFCLSQKTCNWGLFTSKNCMNLAELTSATHSYHKMIEDNEQSNQKWSLTYLHFYFLNPVAYIFHSIFSHKQDCLRFLLPGFILKIILCLRKKKNKFFTVSIRRYSALK